MNGKRLVGIYILEILNRYSGPERKLLQGEILEYLDRDYNVSITRKTLSEYVGEMREAGYVCGMRGIYGTKRFSDSELRLLIDGVLFGQHVPEKPANELIGKLKELSPSGISHRMKHICYLERMNHTVNEKLYDIIDAIDSAIEKNRKVELTFCSFDIHGNLNDWGTKVVDPYYMVTDKCRYYLICYAGRNDDLENRRLDRISNVRILEDEVRTPIRELKKYSNGFDLADYMREHIYMFSGDSKAITIRIRKKSIGDFIDWYGRDYRIEENNEDEETVLIRLDANENAVFYWALQYGGIAEVVKPLQLRDRIRKELIKMMEKYTEGGISYE